MRQFSRAGILVVLCVFVSIASGDTFKNKETGEVFTGFVTQKVTAGKTLVYNNEEGKMTPVVLGDYQVTAGPEGRRSTVSLLVLDEPGVFLSQTVSKAAAESIILASNKGPQAIILKIDSPGGRGEAMRTIADAILETRHCPVIAYISEGAFSAAAVIALACDRVYMSPTAGIGSVGAFSGYSDNASFAEHLSIYNSDFLLSYDTYVEALAQKRGLPELICQALIDKRISIIEVANIDGSRSLIQEKDRQPTQTMVRTICQGTSGKLSQSDISPSDVTGKTLKLTAKDSIELGLAIGIADSYEQIKADLGVSEAKLIPIPSVEKVMKKFTAAQRKIEEGLRRIDQYEKDVEVLSDQFTKIDNQLRTGTQTREIKQGGSGYRYSRRRSTVPYNLDEINIYDSGSSRQSRRTGQNRPRSETIITEVPRIDIEVVYNQLTAALRDLVGEYRRTLNIVKRWPSGLPPKIAEAKLIEDMDSASMELDRLYRYQPIYPDQNQYQNPPRSSRTRRGY